MKKLKNELNKLSSLPLLNKQRILAACPTVPETPYTPPVKRNRMLVKVTALAMSALLVIGGGIGIGGALAVEAKEYKETMSL